MPSAPQTAAPAQTVAAAAVGGAANSLRAGSKKGSPAAKLAPLATKAQTGPFTLIGSLTTPHPPVSIALNGNLAYVCTPNEIVTVDITNPANPQTLAVTTTPLINNSADINCSVQRGVLAVFADQVSSLIGNTPGFVAFSLTDPQHPQVIQATPIDKRFFQSPTYIGNYAFVPTGATTFIAGSLLGQFGDLLAIDLTNFSAPNLVGTVENPEVSPVFGGANLVLGATQAANQLIYLGGSTGTGGADGVGRLQIVDVTNPAAMQIVGSLPIAGTALLNAPLIQGTVGVAVGNSGGYDGSATCCDGDVVVVTLNLLNRRNPAMQSFTLTPFTYGAGGGGARIGNNQFLVAGVNDQTGANVLLLIDTTNPYAPVLTTYPLAAPLTILTVSGNYLYASSGGALQIYSVPGNTAPVTPCPTSIDAALVIAPSGALASVLPQVQAAATHFLSNLLLPPDQVAVVVAGATATLAQGLTSNQTAAASAINGITTTAKTNIGAGIVAAQNALLGANGNPTAGNVMVIFSDGQDTAPPSSTAQAAAAAKAAGIRIITVGYGSTASNLTALASTPADAHTAVNLTAAQPVTVVNANTAVAVLNIDPQAAPGPRTCTVSTGLQVVTMAGAFTVQGAATGSAPSNVVTLESVTPGTASAGGTVSVAFQGTTSGTFQASNVTITLTPVVAGGATIAVPGSTLGGGGTQWVVGFAIPQGLSPSAPVTYQLGVSGKTSTGLVFASANTLPLTVTPSAGLAAAAPPAGARGTTAKVRLYVHGVSLLKASVQANFGDGIRVGSGAPGGFGDVMVNDANIATALVRIAADAPVGPRTVALTVNGQSYTRDQAFAVIAEYGPAQQIHLVSVTPSQGLAADTYTLMVTGLPSGQINPANVTVTVTDSNNRSWGLNLDSVQLSGGGIGQIAFEFAEVADPGSYVVSVSGTTTGYALFQSANTLTFQVLAEERPSIALIYVSGGDCPGSGFSCAAFAGTSPTVLVHGTDTHFVQGQTVAQLCPGVSVGGAAAGAWGPVTVTGPTDFSANLQIAANVAGSCQFQIQTGSELISSYLTVETPAFSVYPWVVGQGQTVQVYLTGTDTHFAPGVSVASFGPDISVGGAVAGQPGPIIVTDATDATVTIQVSATAALGPRQVTVQTGSETATATQFYVQAPSLYPNPSYAYPGQTVQEYLYGENTNFAAGVSVASFGPDISVGGAPAGQPGPINVTGPTNATATIQVSATAATGPRTVTVQTGSQIVTSPWFSVDAPDLWIDPYDLTSGATTQVIFHVEGAALQPGAQVQFGPGITVGNAAQGAWAPVTILSDTEATAAVTVSPSAPLGDGTVSLQNGTQILVSDYQIEQVGTFVSVTPATVVAGTAVTLTIKTSGITLVPGQTDVEFSGNVIAGVPQVTAPDTLTVTLQVPLTQPSGPLSVAVYVPYGSVPSVQVLTVTNPYPLIDWVSPGWGSPGQTVQITVVVENMALVQGQTLASLGDGISVQNAPVGAYGPVQVIAPNQAQITAIISPAAPSGARTLYLKTGSQVAQGTFTVW